MQVVYENATDDKFSKLRTLVYDEMYPFKVTGKGNAGWYRDTVNDRYLLKVKAFSGCKVYCIQQPLEVL